jgi:glycerol uptake facilitator-like aquaporin
LLKASKDRIASKLTSSQKRFAAEVIGTFVVVVLATGSVVIDAKFGGKLGLPFIAFAPFVGVAIGVYLFGKISMAHFNPAVTLGFSNHKTYHQTATLAVFCSRDYRCASCKSICHVYNWY